MKLSRPANVRRRISGTFGWALPVALWVAAATNSYAQSNYEPYSFTTLPGIAPGNINGTGSAARFFKPSGVALDSAGNVYVADTGNNSEI